MKLYVLSVGEKGICKQNVEARPFWEKEKQKEKERTMEVVREMVRARVRDQKVGVLIVVGRIMQAIVLVKDQQTQWISKLDIPNHK